MKIKIGSHVKINYICSLDGGEVFEKGDISFTVGDGEVLLELEDNILGLGVGESKEFSIKKPYGGRLDKLVLDLGVLDIDEDNIKENSELYTIEDGKLFLDLNHPLSGENLNCVATVEEINY